MNEARDHVEITVLGFYMTTDRAAMQANPCCFLPLASSPQYDERLGRGYFLLSSSSGVGAMASRFARQRNMAFAKP